MSKENTYTLLDAIHYPADLRRLNLDQLPEVCRELRQDIINELSCNPGHFAASLGVVELTVALHYVYNTPYDRLVWDVGHQAYGHKILTGRKEMFSTNRKYKGIRPFPSPEESEYDTFACGHASNSISAALGMAVSAKRLGETDRHIVAVIGDGSMSGGLAFEGLNNASSTPHAQLIVRKGEYRSIGNRNSEVAYNLLTADTRGSIELVLMEIPPQTFTADKEHPHTGEETSYVEYGDVDIWLNGERFRLHAGDAIS